MNQLLLYMGLAMAKQGIAGAVRRIMLRVAVLAVVILGGLTAVGFLTASAFVYLAQRHGAVEASLMMAGVYGLITVLGLLAGLLMQARRRQARSPIVPTATGAAADAGNELPGGIVSLGLAAAVGYLLARSMTRKS